MKRAKERSLRVPAPSRPAPTKRIDPTGIKATIVVLIERTTVWFTARLAACEYVILDVDVIDLVFSRTRSKTTTVSYNEYPKIVKNPITVAGVTSKPTRA